MVSGSNKIATNVQTMKADEVANVTTKYIQEHKRYGLWAEGEFVQWRN